MLVLIHVSFPFAELQELKKKVVQCIKSNNESEALLNTMDIKIGLLVKNRITLQVMLTLLDILLKLLYML